MPDFGRWEQVPGTDARRSGQSELYVVTDSTGEHAGQFALKRLLNPKRIDRFEREIEALAKIDHLHVLDIVDYDLGPKHRYFVTPYLELGSLADARPFSSLTLGELFDLFGQICDGLIEAHRHGIVHRDIKPDNLLLASLRPPHVLIADFGLCFVRVGDRLTVDEHEVVGSRYYMAPELEDGRISLDQATPSCDIYSLGKVLYWLLSSGRIFSREKHREDDYNLVNLLQNPYLEHVNARLLDQMIVEDPSSRFRRVEDVRPEVVRVKHLVVGEYNVLSKNVTRPCKYCGLGVYYTSPSSAAVLTAAAGVGSWEVLICSHCGHAEVFRLDHE